MTGQIVNDQFLNQNPNYLLYFDYVDPSTLQPLQVWANMPETLSFGIGNHYEPLMSGGFTDLAPLFGESFAHSAQIASSITQSVWGVVPQASPLSIQVWQGTGPLEMDIPLYFQTYADPVLDVLIPCTNLIKMAAPYRIGGADKAQKSSAYQSLASQGDATAAGQLNWNLLHAPGPTVYDVMTNPNNPKGNVALYLGTTMYLPQIVITQLSFQVDSHFTDQGYPLSVEANVSIRTLFNLTQEDYLKYLWPGINTYSNQYVNS
jgi:hypothetical protein